MAETRYHFIGVNLIFETQIAIEINLIFSHLLAWKILTYVKNEWDVGSLGIMGEKTFSRVNAQSFFLIFSDSHSIGKINVNTMNGEEAYRMPAPYRRLRGDKSWKL
jgi:hypothetical protein